MTWRKIKTAPKDGTLILGCRELKPGVWNYHVIWWDEDTDRPAIFEMIDRITKPSADYPERTAGGWWNDGGRKEWSVVDPPYTHWKPLPEPPPDGSA